MRLWKGSVTRATITRGLRRYGRNFLSAALALFTSEREYNGPCGRLPGTQDHRGLRAMDLHAAHRGKAYGVAGERPPSPRFGVGMGGE